MRTVSRRKSLYGCRLSRRDVEMLAGVLGFGAEDTYSKVSTKIESDTLEESDLGKFFAEVGDAESLTELRLYVSRRGEVGSASVDLSSRYVSVYVSGDDETRVRGLFDSLLVRVKRTQRPASFASSDAVLSFLFCVMTVTVLVLGEALPRIDRLPAVLGVVALLLFFGAWLVPRARSVIVLKERQRSKEWLRRTNSAILTTCAIFTAIFAFLAWKYPLK